MRHGGRFGRTVVPIGALGRDAVVATLSAEYALLGSVRYTASPGLVLDNRRFGSMSTGVSLVSLVLLAIVRRDIDGGGRKLARAELKSREIELGEEEKVEEAVNGLGDDVENAVENHFGIGGDDIGTVGKTPSYEYGEVKISDANARTADRMTDQWGKAARQTRGERRRW